MQHSNNKKAQEIRDVIRYIQKFQNAVIVIYLDDEIIDSPLFTSHIRDISLIHQAGLKVIIVPGARKRIDQVLSDSNISWTYKDNVRITKQDAIPQIKMAAFDVSNMVMTSLAANQITAIIGNWVRSRGKGIIDGLDFGTAGEIDKLQIDAIKSILDNGFIPIFPCIGWSATGKPYNISSISLAQQIAVNLKADKLFYLIKDSVIDSKNFTIPSNLGLSAEGEIPAMNLEEVSKFIQENSESKHTKILSLLDLSSQACRKGVSRCHIINGSIAGSILCEIFSDLGSGTMIYSNNYGGIRSMTQSDIPAVLSVMAPFIERKILLPRTDKDLLHSFSDYIVYEIDGGIRACAALHVYPDMQAEIAGVAVDEAFSNLGIGPKLISYLIDKAKSMNTKGIFIMTTQSSDWFEKIGFYEDDIQTLPPERMVIWNAKRNSKLFRLS